MEEKTRLTRFKLNVQQRYAQLSRQEKRVADYLLSTGRPLFDDTLSNISQQSETSKATVVRFCKHLGYCGLKEMKIDLCAKEATEDTSGLVTWDDNGETIFTKVFSQSIRTMETSFKETPVETFANAAAILTHARAIDLIGIGGSSLVVHHFKTEFMRLGKQINAFTDHYSIEQSIVSVLTSPADVLVAVSCSGRTDTIVKASKSRKDKGAKIISFTTDAQSPLALLSDDVLFSSTCPVFCDDIHSYTRLVQIAQITTLYLMTACLMGKENPQFKATYIEASNYQNIAQRSKGENHPCT